ncbi:uncharacterized protein LOC8057293 [Sorghum bicolor]|nr:uncharacterized protein LOC8057293 [Sorghum bicolor]|eukprot:XP_002461848.2 uncharacterized protein LOC8057293 [Sorghum bicolor]
MAVDPSWLADGPGESSQKGTEMFKLHNAVSSWSIFWDAPQVTKVSCLLPEAMNLRRPPSDSSRTPKNMSADPLHQHSGGQSSKRLTRDHSVNSPYKKSSRNHSIDKTLDNLNNMIKRSVMREQKRHKKCKDTYREESAQVKQILREDGYKEGDEVFMQVLNLTLDDNRRHAFLDLETKVGPLQWVKVSWAFSATTSK